MIPIVIQLQNDALDRSIAISDLLRKAYFIAKKLNLSEFEEWINNELNGYEASDVPCYRKMRGKLQSYNSHYNEWIDILFEDSKEAEIFSKRNLNQAIPEIEHLIVCGNKTFNMPLPPSVQKHIYENVRGGYYTEIRWFTSVVQIVGIIEKVRTIILDWSLELEKKGILGNELTFTNKEKEMAQNTVPIINNHFHGNVNNSQIQQANNSAVQEQNNYNSTDIKSFIEEFEKALPNLNLTQEKESEAKAELQTLIAQNSSPKPKMKVITESLNSLLDIIKGVANGATLLVTINTLLEKLI